MITCLLVDAESSDVPERIDVIARVVVDEIYKKGLV